jgi:isopenicillin-N epimerase
MPILGSDNLTRRQLILSSAAAALVSGAFPAQSSPRLEDPEGENLWSRVKKEYLVEDGLAYFNTGTYGPSLRRVFETECRAREAMNLNFNRYFIDHHIGQPFLDLVDRVAAFVGAGRHEITFTSGATEAMSYIVNGLDLKRGDEILTTTHEHQGGIYPWLLGAMRRGFVVRQLPMPSPPESGEEILDLFASAITSRTRALSFCHLQYTDGCLLPVQALCRLCRDRGLISVVDGAQAVGMLDFKVGDLDCDFYVTSLHKWLNGPYGTGLLILRPEMVERLWPTVVTRHDGWDEVDRYGVLPEESVIDFAVDWPRALLKYDANLHYFGPLIWSLLPAIEFHQSLGQARIEARIRRLATLLRERLSTLPGIRFLTPEKPELAAGLLSFKLPGTETRPLAVELRRDEQIIIRYVTHGPIDFDVNRACTHIFNTEEEIDRLVEALRRRSARA